MEIQIRRHSCDLTRQSLNAFSKLFEEIPTFDEAFDPASLRKFFQEHECTNSQSTYSPHKDISIFEDAHSQATNEIDSLLSPSGNSLSDFQVNCEPRSSRYNFSWNLKLDGNGLNMGKNLHKIGFPSGLPFIIKRTASNKNSDCQEGSIKDALSPKSGVKEVAKKFQVKIKQGKEGSFEVMGRKKQIFKIIREDKSKEVSLNIKRNQSSYSSSEDVGPTKKVKSYTGTRKYSAEVSSTRSSALKRAGSTKYDGFQSIMKNF